MQNMLLMGSDDGLYAETANMAGVAATEWTWGSALLDVDLDGYLDLLLTTGHAYDAMDGDAQMRAGGGRHWRQQLLDFPKLDLKNLAFHNGGDGIFSQVADGWGLGTEPDVSHGFALADLDQDGDLDVVVNRLNATAGIFRNDASRPRIAVRLRGIAPNRHGIGAQVRVTGDGLPPRQREVIAGGLYLSSSEPLLTFAARDSVTIEVRWRAGHRSIIHSAPAGHVYEVFESGGSTASTESSPPPESVPLMESAPLELVHHETPYQDFARQPLLPKRLSQRGPAVALGDLDGDGDDDIIVGSGKGAFLTYAINHSGSFAAGQPLGSPATGDHAGVVVLPGGDVMAALSNYERTPSQAGDPSAVVRLRLAASEAVERLDLGPETPGPLVLADFDGDRLLDLFMGGHFLPGRYPQPTSSKIFLGEGGGFAVDPERSASFAEIGLVSSAAAGDMDGDGDIDVVLAMDWGPVRIYLNDGQGRFADHTADMGLEAYTGWWNGVALGDFDGDGRLDVAATNWGSNTMYARGTGAQVAYVGDLDRNGILDVVESYHDPTLQAEGLVRDWRVLARAIPGLSGRVSSYHAFSELSTAELFGDALSTMERHEASTLLNTVFLNRTTHFEALPLPVRAQWAPAFAPVVGDFNGDGHEDLFLSQNFFAMPSSTPRMDAGRGQLLLGDGRGSFEPLPHDVSGIIVHGEQRGAAAGDLNQDGRTDLVVTQNGAPTRLFWNVGAQPGLRVQLRGPMEGIGATLRLRYTDGTYGPVRVVSAGSGYWSQNSLPQVLGVAHEAQSIWVQWPGGTITETAVGANQFQVVVQNVQE